METEVIYLGHDNSIDLVLKNNNTAIDLSGMNRMTLTFGSVALDSTNSSTQIMTWNKVGYATGELRIKMATVSASRVTPGSYKAILTLYDATETNGIVWGEIPIIVKDEVEGTT